MNKEIIIFKPFNADFYVWGWKLNVQPTFFPSNEPYTLTFYPEKTSINQELLETLASVKYD